MYKYICIGDKRDTEFTPATCELFGHLVFKGKLTYSYVY